MILPAVEKFPLGGRMDALPLQNPFPFTFSCGFLKKKRLFSASPAFSWGFEAEAGRGAGGRGMFARSVSLSRSRLVIRCNGWTSADSFFSRPTRV
jgi:hypothetical protein